jgi:hypothetical protein
VTLIRVRTRFRLVAQTAVKHAVVAYDEAELEDARVSSFAHDEYFARLSNQRLGHTLLTAFSLASTQVLLKECAPGLPTLSRTRAAADGRDGMCARESVPISRTADCRCLRLGLTRPPRLRLFAQELRRVPRGHGVGSG